MQPALRDDHQNTRLADVTFTSDITSVAAHVYAEEARLRNITCATLTIADDGDLTEVTQATAQALAEMANMLDVQKLELLGLGRDSVFADDVFWRALLTVTTVRFTRCEFVRSGFELAVISRPKLQYLEFRGCAFLDHATARYFDAEHEPQLMSDVREFIVDQVVEAELYVAMLRFAALRMPRLAVMRNTTGRRELRDVTDALVEEMADALDRICRSRFVTQLWLPLLPDFYALLDALHPPVVRPMRCIRAQQVVLSWNYGSEITSQKLKRALLQRNLVVSSLVIAFIHDVSTSRTVLTCAPLLQTMFTHIRDVQLQGFVVRPDSIHAVVNAMTGALNARAKALADAPDASRFEGGLVSLRLQPASACMRRITPADFKLLFTAIAASCVYAHVRDMHPQVEVNEDGEPDLTAQDRAWLRALVDVLRGDDNRLKRLTIDIPTLLISQVERMHDALAAYSSTEVVFQSAYVEDREALEALNARESVRRSMRAVIRVCTNQHTGEPLIPEDARRIVEDLYGIDAS